MDSDRHPDAIARLIAPSLALSGCLYASMWRDTLAAGALTDEQRSSHFPATPYCGMTWVLDGDGVQVLDDGSERRLPGRALVGGPRSRPAQFRSDAGTRCFMVAWLPDALHALTGLDLASLVDGCESIESVLGPEWQTLSASLLAAPDEHACQARLEAFLLPRWRALAQSQTAPPRRYRDWMENLALKAVAGGHGESLRQVERRIKRWSGQSLRALRSISRAEAAFHQARGDLEAGAVLWSALAQDAGYADQAHLCREIRRVSGFSPEELRRRIFSHEAFWAYRVWV
ncbi:MAG: helix-turn-helix domain-containing protein [Roseateles asaccharophilus]|uniref:AraC family transcriptional regulator n=1 Tax=Roseateles asaccharophilus TaxID=582607 RepID=A0A4R6NDN7_9BURK|nr:AraC family transcriptional regulator [Roseateles asaccharophilus]MDN3543166.1 AraC family transcriptional regulator [Roseateles asaccharophilus]TDP13135.1 AraC family transcriptional regulator [Roseateles asaccharophilus]